MHIIIGGCGRLGSEVAETMSADPDADLVVVDLDPDTFDRLGTSFNGETLQGDITDRDVLEQAGVDRADGLLAVTRSDNVNLMAVQTATHLYGVPRTVARLFNPERESTYRKLGVRHVSGTGILAKLFLNEFRDSDFPHHITFDLGDVEIVDLRLGADADGLTVSALEDDSGVRVAAVRRDDRVVVATPDFVLATGDQVTTAMHRARRRHVIHLLQRA